MQNPNHQNFNNQQPPMPPFNSNPQIPYVAPNMGDLKRCKNCSNLIYKQASACPYCGTKNGLVRFYGCGVSIAVFAVMIIIVSGVMALVNNSDSDNNDNIESKTNTSSVIYSDTVSSESETDKNDNSDIKSSSSNDVSQTIKPHNEYKEIDYIELYDNCDDYYDEYVKIYGEIDSLGDDYIIFRNGLEDGLTTGVHCSIVSDNLNEYKKGDYVEVSGKVDIKLFGALMLEECFITNDGDSVKEKIKNYETKKQEEASISREDYIRDCQTYSYEEISRNPNNYKDKKAKFEGEVIQVIENGDKVTLRVDITKEANEFAEGGYIWSNTIYVDYTRKAEDESRVLEGDVITMYGKLNGIKNYMSILGSEVNLPYLKAEYIDIPNT